MHTTNDWDALPTDIKDRLGNATVFYSKEWYEYNKRRNETMFYCWNDSYILVTRIKKVRFLKGGILDSEPFCFDNNDSFEKQQQFLDEYCLLVKKMRLTDWVQTELAANFSSYPKGAVVYGAGNYMLTLENCSDEELLQKMHSKNRNMIRRAIKEGVTVDRSGDNLLSDYKSIEDQVWGRQGRTLRSLDYYSEIIKSMPTTSSIAVAYDPDGVPQAGVLFLYTKAMGYYHHGASKTDHVVGAHNYLLFQELCHLKDLGVKKICFVGYRRASEYGINEKADKIQQFKKRFADEELETFGFKVEFNKLHYKLYRLANMLINKEQFIDRFDNRSRNYPEYNPKA